MGVKREDRLIWALESSTFERARTLPKSSLERQTKSHLNDPGGERRTDRAKGTAGSRGVGRLEIRFIEQIEELSAVFQFALLAAQTKVFVQAQVGLIQRVTADRVAAGVTERVGSRDAHRNEDISLIEVVVDITRALRRQGIAHNVGAISWEVAH